MPEESLPSVPDLSSGDNPQFETESSNDVVSLTTAQASHADLKVALDRIKDIGTHIETDNYQQFQQFTDDLRSLASRLESDSLLQAVSDASASLPEEMRRIWTTHLLRLRSAMETLYDSVKQDMHS